MLFLWLDARGRSGQSRSGAEREPLPEMRAKDGLRRASLQLRPNRGAPDDRYYRLSGAGFSGRGGGGGASGAVHWGGSGFGFRRDFDGGMEDFRECFDAGNQARAGTREVAVGLKSVD